MILIIIPYEHIEARLFEDIFPLRKEGHTIIGAKRTSEASSSKGQKMF